MVRTSYLLGSFAAFAVMLFIAEHSNGPLRLLKIFIPYHTAEFLSTLSVCFYSPRCCQDIIFHKLDLVDVDGVATSSLDYQSILGWPELGALCLHIEQEDRVLMMGANTGTSCLLAEKWLGGPRHRRLTCVEPNPALVSTLRRNQHANDAKFGILPGIVKDGPCERTMLSSCDGNEGRCDGTRVITAAAPGSPEQRQLQSQHADRGSQQPGNNERATFVNCTSLHHAEGSLKGGSATVVFADCEGCLPALLTKPHLERMSQLRLIVYEKDQADEEEGLASYTRMEDRLMQTGFRRVHWGGGWAQA